MSRVDVTTPLVTAPLAVRFAGSGLRAVFARPAGFAFRPALGDALRFPTVEAAPRPGRDVLPFFASEAVPLRELAVLPFFALGAVTRTFPEVPGFFAGAAAPRWPVEAPSFSADVTVPLPLGEAPGFLALEIDVRPARAALPFFAEVPPRGFADARTRVLGLSVMTNAHTVGLTAPSTPFVSIPGRACPYRRALPRALVRHFRSM